VVLKGEALALVNIERQVHGEALTLVNIERQVPRGGPDS
jgi:hypothetical protein